VGNLKTSCAFPLDLSEEISNLSLSGSFEARFSLRVTDNETPFFRGGTAIVNVNGSVVGNVLTVSCPRESNFFQNARSKEAEIDGLIRTLNPYSRIVVETESQFSAFVVYAK
jgi:hypothetical protein